MDGRPCRILDAGATGGLQEPSLDELVEGGLEIVQRPRVGVAGGERVVLGCREGGVEEARLSAGKLEIRLANYGQPALRAG
jgi:hypothetical protein